MSVGSPSEPDGLGVGWVKLCIGAFALIMLMPVLAVALALVVGLLLPIAPFLLPFLVGSFVPPRRRTQPARPRVSLRESRRRQSDDALRGRAQAVCG